MLKTLRERLEFARHCTVHRRSLPAQRRWQEARVRLLLQYAYAHVPLWRETLDREKITPDSVRSLEDLQKLPITSKYTYLGKAVEEYIDGSRPHHAIWFLTSGTSGTPFSFLFGDKTMLDTYSDFGSLRFLWWRGEPLSRIPVVNMARIKIRAAPKEHRLFVPVEQFLKDPREALGLMARFGAEIVSAYPSILLEMARLIEKDPDVVRPHPRYILSFGEMLLPALREHVTRVLGAELYDRYGLEEIGAVGVECEKHDGFHINTESVVVEVVDDAYRSVPDLQKGRIIVSDLLNYNMPFIRYDAGDTGKISHAPCACGLRSPRLWVEGRYSAFLDFPHRRIHHLEFDGAMDGFVNSILQYQIAKRSGTEVLARVIPGPAYGKETEKRIQEKLSALVGPDVRIVLQSVERLPITPRGKSRIVIDESNSPQRK